MNTKLGKHPILALMDIIAGGIDLRKQRCFRRGCRIWWYVDPGVRKGPRLCGAHRTRKEN